MESTFCNGILKRVGGWCESMNFAKRFVAPEPEGRKQRYLPVELSRAGYVSAQGLFEPKGGAKAQFEWYRGL